MEPAGPLWKLSQRSHKKLLEDVDPELDAPVKDRSSRARSS